ncbi:hypothetical protein INT47_006770 [Mucor saturninus]|uniref:Uncharacterized protein n=1 Tax=Mucor saturninus TaxID=64648 RepID=A0A8H7QZR1_9FUNG|nr:hypothetical protein INT47_006770 [Mucor saturninus]
MVAQLLGLDTHQIKSTFQQRFHDLSLAILSNDTKTIDIGHQLNCLHQPLNSTDQILQLLSSTEIDVLFVDFTDQNNPWHIINKLLVLENKDLIQCVVSPFTLPEQVTSPIMPRQSYQMKNGLEVNTNDQTALMYSYFHSGSARTDTTTQYTLQNIQSHGGNNKILAWHFLAEIAHKLGFVSKYGA